MKKKVLRVLAALLVAGVGGLFGLQFWLRSQVERGRLIAEMEKGWNCRADLASTSLSLFRSPAIVEIRGLRLTPRDDQVTKPLNARAPIDPAQVLLSADKIDLAVSLSDLIHRRAAIKRLHVQNFSLRDEEDVVTGAKSDEPHEGLLDILFSRPDEFEVIEEEPAPARPKTSASAPAGMNRARLTSFDGGILAPASAAGSTADEDSPKASSEPAGGEGDKPAVAKKRKRVRRKREHKPFKASDLIMALSAEEVSVGNAHIDLLERRTVLNEDGGVAEHRERRTVFRNVSVALTDLDVAPDDLAKHNRCSLQLAGSIELDQKITAGGAPPVSQKLVRFDVTGSGFIRPFDAESGMWNPDFTIQAKVGKGAILGGVPIKEALRGKDMKTLDEWGIDFGGVSLGGILGEDATADVHYFRGGKLIVKGDTRLVFPDYEITLRDGSWFNTHEDLHRATCVLLVGPELSKRLLAQVKAHIAKDYGGDLVASAAESVLKAALMDKQGRLEFKFISKGRLSKPSQEWDNPIGDVAQFLKQNGAAILESLFNKK